MPLRALVVDWGGVLTGSLDTAMSSWASSDGVDFEHFRDVMRSWVGRPEGSAGSEGSEGPQVDRSPGPGRSQAGELPARDLATPTAGTVAALEQADDNGPAGQSPVHRLERGEMSAADFELALASALTERGSRVSPGGLLGRVLGGLSELQGEMVALVRRARARGLRTALLSNSWGDHYPEDLWDGLFDAVVISARVGMRKPEPAIFSHTAHLLALPAGACVMVDDLPHNVRGAAEAGMVGVLHRSYEETVAELEILFGLSLR
jgi:hypothetical protein